MHLKDSYQYNSSLPLDDSEQSKNDFIVHWWQQNESSVIAVLKSIVRPIIKPLGLSPDEASRELLVEVAKVVFAKTSRFDPSRGTVRQWILGIANNCAKQWKERLFAENKKRIVETGDSGSGDTISGVWERIQSEQQTERDVTGSLWVERVLASCSESDRDLIQGIVLEGNSSEEMAQKLTDSKSGQVVLPGTVRVRLHRALTRLKYSISTEEREMLRPRVGSAINTGATR